MKNRRRKRKEERGKVEERKKFKIFILTLVAIIFSIGIFLFSSE